MLSTTKIELYFKNYGSFTLEKAVFSHPLLDEARHSVRGKVPDIFGNKFTFQWTPAVRALMILLIRTKIWPRPGPLDAPAILCGGAGSQAASLDYAINKKPMWLLDMFGLDRRGNTIVSRLIRRTNSERKRGGAVAIAINTESLNPAEIKIFLEGKELICSEEITVLLDAIASVPKKANSLGEAMVLPAADAAPCPALLEQAA